MSKGKAISELLEEARKESGASRLAGHDIMDLERFAPDIRHMIASDVFSHESSVGFKGERMRLFLTDEGHKKILASQGCDEIKIGDYVRVAAGHLYYDHKGCGL